MYNKIPYLVYSAKKKSYDTLTCSNNKKTHGLNDVIEQKRVSYDYFYFWILLNEFLAVLVRAIGFMVGER